MRSRIWRFAVAPSNAASKNCNISAQLQSLWCITALKLFWKIYLLYDFWRAQTCSFRSVFWTTCTKFDNCCQRYITSGGNNIYVHIYIIGPKLLRWNFLQISQLSIRSGAHNLFRRFLDFSQFLTSFSRKLWHHLATKMRTMQCN